MEKQIIEILSDISMELIEDMDRDLLASDILDSFDIVKLVVALEEAFDIVIDADLIVPENFQTANTIIALVKSIIDNRI
ncbi:MAG: acyl carrier protein [Lachnospiraceae bacterium]|nr:acyl carrier protein [Lachnospiraceae bacterium]